MAQSNTESKADRILSGLGEIKYPEDWKVDPTSGFRTTSKEEATVYFEGEGWKTAPLDMAAISLRKRNRVVFVTAGFDIDWNQAKEVVVEEIKSEAQMDQDFSDDVPTGVFYVFDPYGVKK